MNNQIKLTEESKMNAYLEMPVWELRQAYDNFTKAKKIAQVKFDRLRKAYVKEFGHEPAYEKGLGGHNLLTELMKCKENKQSPMTVEGEPESIVAPIGECISLFFDPPQCVKDQRRVIGTIVEAASNENAKVLVDVDICDFIRRWKNGGGFLLNKEK